MSSMTNRPTIWEPRAPRSADVGGTGSHHEVAAAHSSELTIARMAPARCPYPRSAEQDVRFPPTAGVEQDLLADDVPPGARSTQVAHEVDDAVQFRSLEAKIHS